MNIDNIKTEIDSKKGKKVLITVYGMRGRTDRYEGTIYNTYPNIFTIDYCGDEKSFAYRDIITKDISIKYL